MNTKEIKGYKVFNPDWTCRDFQYEVGKTYKHDGNIDLCGSGFHFCIEAVDCFNYYVFDSENKVAEVVATGLVETGDDKSVTNEITIVRELEWHEVLKLVNTGKECTGYRNSGNGNSGDWNSGDWNSGDWNSGNGNNGAFCTEEPKIKIFDVESDMTLSEWRNTEAAQILNLNFENNVWIYSENMTDEEKEQHPTHETTGGYLRVFSFKEACKNMWNDLTDREKEVIKSIPNFNEDKFEEITGIRI